MANRFGRFDGMGGQYDLKGQVFGDLTVLRSWPGKHKGKRMWQVQCTCISALTGKPTVLVVRHDYLLHSNSPKTHCGCKNRGLPTLYPQEYHIWNSMNRRCYVFNHVGYPAYGGRGIRVCDRWHDPKTGFAAFFEDMGRRPSKDHSLDRRDANGNYEKDNCKWATSKEQSRNKRNSIFLPHPVHGGIVPAAEVAEHLGITYQSMRARYIKAGTWPTTKGIK